MIVGSDEDVLIERFGKWFTVNSSRFGYLMRDDEGAVFFVCHRKRHESFAREYGFHVPRWFFKHTKADFIFETKTRKGVYVHYRLERTKKQRLVMSGAYVFIGLGRMSVVYDAAHYVKPRMDK